MMERWFPESAIGGADPLADLVAAEQARFPFPLPASARTELDAVTEIADDGEVIWTNSIAGWNELSEAVADFTEVAAPALAVVAVTRDPGVLFPWITPQSAPAQVVAEAARCGTLIGDSAEADIAALDTANPGIEVEVWPDFHHYVFLQDPAATEAAIEDWLTRSGLD
jgi:hypothetical protein